MATLRDYIPLTLDGSGGGLGTGAEFVVQKASSERYVLFDGFITQIYEGRFTYDEEGAPAGTLTAIGIYGGGDPFLQIRGMDRDFQTFIGLAGSDDGGDLAYLLSDDDVVNGSDFGDILRGFDGDDRLVGGLGNNKLFGDAGNDRLIGGAVRDFLNGGTGADLMQGGNGDDRYVVDSIRDKVVELAGEGTDVVVSSINYALGANVENLFLTGSRSINGAGTSAPNELQGNGGRNVLNGGDGNDQIRGGGGSDRLIGGLGDDWLVGGWGNDVLDGRFGDDLMQGGGGNDRYIVNSINARVEEAIGGVLFGPNFGGIDTVVSFSSFVMPRNIEKVVLAGDDASFAIGNTEANEIRGNDSANLLRGGWGDDLILGGGGADRIEGEGGIDRFAGGSGADVFVFRDSYDIGYGNYPETILDFQRGDLVHLAGMDADFWQPGDQAFTFIGANPFSGSSGELAAGELRYEDGVLYGDNLGFGDSEFEIVFANGVTLEAVDFLL